MLDINKTVEENYEFLVQARRHFHKYPELSGEEYETSAYIKKYLDEWGVSYETAGNTSIVATIKGEKPGRTIAIRGDFDALPIQEATGLEFASVREGVMHACGHDCHATYMLGAAKILKDLTSELHGTVKIIFQEAEETGQGAKRIIEAGLFEGVDEVFGLHGSQRTDLGFFTLGYGVMSTYGGGITIEIKGKGGHSSKPNKTVNPLIVASEIVNAVNTFAAYGFDSFDQVVLVPTVLHTGTKSNVIPETAHLELNYRFFDIKYKDILEKGVYKLAKNIADAYGAEIAYSFYGPGSVVNNNRESVDRAIRLIKEHFGEAAAIISKPEMGGEDFSLYQLHAPGVFIHVGAARDGVYEQGHTDKTFMDDESLKYGEELLLYYVLDYLNET